MNKETIIKGLTKLKANYISQLKSLSTKEAEEMINMWQEQLDDIEEESFNKAINNIIRKDEFFPNVARVRKEAISLLAPELKQETALSQWEVVLEAIRKHGNNKTKAYEMFNERTKAIMDKMNFNVLNEMLSSDLYWKQKDFITMYNDDTEIITDDLKIGIGLNELLKLNPAGDEE